MKTLNPLQVLIRFSLNNKLLVWLLTVALITWGLIVAPFERPNHYLFNDFLPHNPVPVDAIPNLGDNQQIVFTQWPGHSPQDIEDQITYPLTTALLGLPNVKTVRSYSMLGTSSIYIIFNEDSEFYWTRSRIIEKLASLTVGTLPQGVQPQLGPDATGLGQIFWYTLEGRDQHNNPTGGWDLHTLRSTQDWQVSNALQSVEGVAEVASTGGFVKEYQIDVNPDALRAFNITLSDVFNAVRASNLDVGARTIEINKVEYVIRGLGFIKSLDNLKHTVITQRNNVPITLEQIATIGFGPALRRGVLNKAGSEAVGGVIVARYGQNPEQVIKRINQKILNISQGLPSKTLQDGTISQVRIIPFYDRSQLIKQTINTLNKAIYQQLLITLIVVILLMLHLRSALLIAGVMPLAVLSAFIGMKLFNVDANVVALAGIAIAIGTIVDMAIILIDNINKHLKQALPNANPLTTVYTASSEVAGAITTAVITTIISFLPIFTMEGAEGKLFTPLAYTKTFTLVGAIIITLIILPTLAHSLLRPPKYSVQLKNSLWLAITAAGIYLPFGLNSAAPVILMASIIIVITGLFNTAKTCLPIKYSLLHNNNISKTISLLITGFITLLVALLLAQSWQPLGVEYDIGNAFFVIITIGGILGFFRLFIAFYPRILAQLLRYKKVFIAGAMSVAVLGFSAGFGLNNVLFFMPQALSNTQVWQNISTALPGLGKEFMPTLDEGSFLFMPSAMPHASIGEVADILKKQNIAISAIPEVEQVVGKLGRAQSPLDPAPISMIETMVSYKPEYKSAPNGDIMRFKYDKKNKVFLRDNLGNLIPERSGKPFRQWREHIKTTDDIWQAIAKAGQMTGVTSAPKLQPIATRLIMLQSGIRAPMGIKIFGPTLEAIESAALQIEALLKEVPSVNAAAVLADRTVGKPYLEIAINRNAIARYGIKVQTVQEVIEVAIGGKTVSQAIEGRERYAIRVRYQRELRDSINSIENILVTAPNGVHVPLKALAHIKYQRGPQVIKGENTFLLSYVLFDKAKGAAEITAVNDAQKTLNKSIANGQLTLPSGVSFQFTGNYQHQIRAEKKLQFIIPLALLLIIVVLYLQFKSLTHIAIIFSAIAFAWSGGFLLLWLYNQAWFLDITFLGHNLRQLFNIQTIHLSVAVWVGFLALFGIATDDGVLITTYLKQQFTSHVKRDGPAPFETIHAIHTAVVMAGTRRIRPAVMTTVTTLIALLPVMSSAGRGAEIMTPMAIPIFGGMLLAMVSVFLVPVLFCAIEELKLKNLNKHSN
ncbi:efflux RND transporter permease subunit [Marinagarivorans algicola]|uniref:efflux RND transporter permease subunit n=1 Tax=Marinagarivorans algicola TaxID=1513270 RepID=UPI0006B46474|nr:efflux RND transporter permease subunit [Marinagarivorans algicola]